MAANHHSASEPTSKRHIHEGPKNHYLAFALSILLTVLAFVVVYAEIGRTFTILFIVVLGIIQAVFQLAFWMHMKDRGHVYAITGIAFGFIIALTGVAAVVYWIWW
ncbi:cytochrome C oxidase subunit IV family protein [Paenibacillus ginsengarvi]|uniref:Cytochrome C oxidase subunit IV n=1 Tax=Paenibacillus ginsengarvi TaxID=400777 RepID=A0A3B0AQF6_9BACL|nr:cytochrome C oxidase subunit IV family protein [Paenibacillus ginsengarvi]RKN61397.1 cytochrome C oxidase subunit IV [Paenibacillus ginsengarvi]